MPVEKLSFVWSFALAFLMIPLALAAMAVFALTVDKVSGGKVPSIEGTILGCGSSALLVLAVFFYFVSRVK